MSELDDLIIYKRAAPSASARKIIFEKTGGLCHICGGELGAKWAADHVKPAAIGGRSTTDNFLPACHTCNRLKWHRTPETIRLIMRLGIYARKQIQHDTPLGRKLVKLFDAKEKSNLLRRKKK